MLPGAAGINVRKTARYAGRDCDPLHQELNRGVWEYTRQLLSPNLEVVAVYYRQRFCLLTLAEFGRILLDISDPARGKLREKLRRIEQEQYSLLENARSP